MTNWANRLLLEGRAAHQSPLHHIIPGFKKGDPADRTNYRYFAMGDTLLKVVKRLMARRLFLWAKSELPESFFGFIEGIGTLDMLHVLRRLIEQWADACDINLSMVGLDYEKAYDSIVRYALGIALDAWGVHGDFRNFWESAMQVRNVVLGQNGFADSKEFAQEEGLPTGCPKAPIEFIMFLAWWWRGEGVYYNRPGQPEELIRLKREERKLLPIHDTNYADDQTLLSLFDAVAQDRLDYISAFGPPVGLRPNPPKCFALRTIKFTRFTKGTSTGQKGLKFRRAVVDVDLWVSNKRIRTVDSALIVGGRFDRTARVRDEIVAREQACTQRTKDLMTMIRGAGFSRKRRAVLCDSLIGGKFCYNLSTSAMGAADEKRVDSFQNRQMRIWCRLPPIIYDKHDQAVSSPNDVEFKAPPAPNARTLVGKEVIDWAGAASNERLSLANLGPPLGAISTCVSPDVESQNRNDPYGMRQKGQHGTTTKECEEAYVCVPGPSARWGKVNQLSSASTTPLCPAPSWGVGSRASPNVHTTHSTPLCTNRAFTAAEPASEINQSLGHQITDARAGPRTSRGSSGRVPTIKKLGGGGRDSSSLGVRLASIQSNNSQTASRRALTCRDGEKRGDSHNTSKKGGGERRWEYYKLN